MRSSCGLLRLGEQIARLFLQLADLLVELVDVAHAVFGQQAQAALHFEHGVAQRVGGLLGIGDDGREQVRNALVHAQFDALGVHHDHAHFVGRGLVEDRHDHGVDHDALARAGGAGDQQVRHGFERGHADAAVDVLAQRDGQARVRLRELVGFEHLAQRDQLAPRVGHFDAHGGLAGNALDQDRFGLQAQAQIFGEGGDAAVLDAGLGLELEGGDHRAGVDLHHVAQHVELFELRLDARGGVLEFLLVVGAARRRLR